MFDGIRWEIDQPRYPGKSLSVLRTFVAIDLPESLKRRLEKNIAPLERLAGIKWVEPPLLHLTLNFIGDVEDTRTPELCSVLSREVRGYSPFEIQIGGAGAFPNFNRPRVFWLGLQKGSQPLIEINSRFRDQIEHLGYLQEKKYRPHLTVGRARSRLSPADTEKVKQTLERFQPAQFMVDRIIIYMSVLDRSGPTHTPISTLKLQG